MIPRVHALKRDLRILRREMWPLREVCSSLCREHWEQIDDETRVYLRDCYDHTVQILDLVETYRELGADLTDLYLSSQGHRMNEIMKVLTIIATLFMPLSFMVGVYGMNFDSSVPGNMPELHWALGYPYSLGLMALFLGSLEYVLEEGPRWQWLQDSTIAGFTAVAALSGIGFFWRSATAAEPIFAV